MAPKAVTGIAKLSYGMYLMHLFFLAPIAQLLIGGDVAHPLLPVYVTIPAIAVLTFGCTVVVSKLISYLPGSKYVIG